MLMGMGKRASSSMDEPFRPSSNPRWNRHHRIQHGESMQKAAETAAEAMKSRREDMMDEMEREGLMQEEEEMVELMDKRSGLTLPTPNVEDAGMLMGMGKRSALQNEPYLRLFLVDTKQQGNWDGRVCTRRWDEQVKNRFFYEAGISGLVHSDISHLHRSYDLKGWKD